MHWAHIIVQSTLNSCEIEFFQHFQCIKFQGNKFLRFEPPIASFITWHLNQSMNEYDVACNEQTALFNAKHAKENHHNNNSNINKTIFKSTYFKINDIIKCAAIFNVETNGTITGLKMPENLLLLLIFNNTAPEDASLPTLS